MRRAVSLLLLCRESESHAAISQHLDQHPQAVDGRDADGATPLHWMALHGHLDLLQRMEASHPTLSASPARSGMQPIHWAVTRGRLAIVEHLVARLGRAALDAVDTRLTTPVMVAAQYRDHKVLNWLVTHGADAARVDQDGDTAMHWASYKDDAAGCALLSELSALDPTLPDMFGSNCLHLAATTGAAGAAAWLLRRPEAEALRRARDAKGRTAAEVAASRGHLQLKWLIDHGPDAEPLAVWAGEASAWWRGAVQQSLLNLEAMVYGEGEAGVVHERRDAAERYPWQSSSGDGGTEMQAMQRSVEMRPADEG